MCQVSAQQATNIAERTKAGSCMHQLLLKLGATLRVNGLFSSRIPSARSSRVETVFRAENEGKSCYHQPLNRLFPNSYYEQTINESIEF